jgi:acetyl esterase/lipase
MSKVFVLCFGFILLIALAFWVTPWPMTMIIRWMFNAGSYRTSLALTPQVPTNVNERLNLSYDDSDRKALLDIFSPDLTRKNLPTVFWLHGGGFISGSKEDLKNYAKILSSKGINVVVIDYRIAPEDIYPTPVKQALLALDFLNRNSDRLNLDMSKLFLAGDSAGSQLAGQVANIITNTEYAKSMGMTSSVTVNQLKGLILYCGIYDASSFAGKATYAQKTLMWSYFGSKDLKDDKRIKDFSVTANMTKSFPPFFVSAGNKDPLEKQSRALAERAEQLGVNVEKLFFEQDQTPLAHEYQFDLALPEAREALFRSVEFVYRITPGE